MADRDRLRIAFFADAFPGLSVTFVIDHVAGMLARGHEVEVFAQHHGPGGETHPDVRSWSLLERTRYVGPPTERAPRMRQMLGALLSQPHRVGALVRTLPPWSSDAQAKSLQLFFARAHFDVPRTFDVIHCHFGPNGNLAARLQEWGLLHGPIVTTFHGYDMRAGVASRGAIYAPLRARGERFLSISGYNRRLLEEWGFDPARIVEHRMGIDVTHYDARPPRDDHASVRLLCVANLVEVKGHDHLLRALRAVRERLPDLRWSLRLVGDGALRPSLERRTVDLGLGDAVTFVGGLPRDRVREELAQADLFVLPSLAEATPVALMEAQAAALPVIATRVGAVDEVVRDGRSGRLVPPGDADALTDALAEMVAARDRWSEFGTAGRDHVLARYHLPRLLDELEDVYRDAIASAALRRSDAPA